MKTITRLTTLVCAASLLSMPAAQAHHSFSMFDRDTQLVLTGTVARWAFNNPHTWLYMNVKDEKGVETLWSFEGASPTQLIGRGITGDAVKPGSTITVMFCPLTDKRPGGAIGFVKLEDGTYINPADGGCKTDDATVEKWKGWISKGIKSNKDAAAK